MGSKSRQKPKGILIDQQIKNFANKGIADRGKPAKSGKRQVMILRDVCTDALLRDDFVINERTGLKTAMSGDTDVKKARFKLAKKIFSAGKRVELTSEETTTLKEQIGKHFQTMITGRALELLDPADV